MHVRLIASQLGLMSLGLAAAQGMCGVVAASRWWLGVPGEPEAAKALMIGVLACATVGLALWLPNRSIRDRIERRDALLLVALSWFISPALAAVPFVAWALIVADGSAPARALASPVNAYFECVSGLTTTGASVLSQLDALPKGMHLWRSGTNFIGGLGIVVLFVAVFPSLGVGGKRLLSFETTGPEKTGLLPGIRESARALIRIYMVLNAALLVLLLITGMPPIDAVCHTFSAISTGGFSTKDASVAAFNSAPAVLIISVFMLLGGVNFMLFHRLACGRWRDVITDTELRVYLAGVVLLALACTVAVANHDLVLLDGRQTQASVGDAAIHSLFTVATLATTTGFGTADWDRWPAAAGVVLVLAMLLSACAGSTAGGVKVIRWWIAIRVLISELERAIRPNVIRPLRMRDGSVIDADMKLAVLGFVLGYVLVLGLGAGALMILQPGLDPRTAASAAVASVGNIGPGFLGVGPAQTYESFNDASTLLLSVLMLVGRLEIFAIACLLSPRFWKPD